MIGGVALSIIDVMEGPSRWQLLISVLP